MPSQLLAIVLIISPGEQIGEKLHNFCSLNKILIFGLFLTVNKLVKS
jgi:hypothetical protein